MLPGSECNVCLLGPASSLILHGSLSHTRPWSHSFNSCSAPFRSIYLRFFIQVHHFAFHFFLHTVSTPNSTVFIKHNSPPNVNCYSKLSPSETIPIKPCGLLCARNSVLMMSGYLSHCFGDVWSECRLTPHPLDEGAFWDLFIYVQLLSICRSMLLWTSAGRMNGKHPNSVERTIEEKKEELA